MRPEDLPEVEALFKKQGLDYKFPEIASPLFPIRQVSVDDEGKIVAASVVRLVGETYLIIDPDRDARTRAKSVSSLSRAVYRAAWAIGLDDLVAFIPQEIEEKFKRALRRLGWEPIREGWRTWNKIL